jgi:hypothetical protein
MMHGLIVYGLAQSDEETAGAVRILDRSTRTAKGVVLGEVMEILERRTGPRTRPEDWSGGVEPADVGDEEPVVYPQPVTEEAVTLEALLETAQTRMRTEPGVRAAVDELMRALGYTYTVGNGGQL